MCAKLVLGRQRYDSSKDALYKLHWLPKGAKQSLPITLRVIILKLYPLNFFEGTNENRFETAQYITQYQLPIFENVMPNERIPRTEERSKRSKSKYQTSARSSAPGNNNMPLYIINLKICQLYIQDTTHTHNCNDLHICKFFLIALCKLEKGCPFSHNLRERHNYKVLKSKQIHTLPDSDVLNLCRNLFNRNWTTLPIVCKFYNNEGNCKYRNCQHLHVCKYYVDGKCKFDQRCKRNHSLGSDKQTRKVFENYGIDTIRIAEERLMTALRDAVDKRQVYEDETAGPRRQNRQQKH
ncbi:protein mono-ADP-ribosyltransferase PARP12-like [Dreissena polymorpha]|uniref:protein mono-ADP-ribosyltransferase PARP12-like n=1 Tax=Dreissena polymorpha TaxID=45954 RepID=UPI00226565B9|nr:protein mono-ADP-ribosyltransferase PARP12-like [Dreissena polymorpha]